MRFKIKHEVNGIQYVSLAGILLFYFIVICWAQNIPIVLLFIDIAVTIISAIIYFIEQMVGTTVIVDSGVVIIKHLFSRKTIGIGEICGLNIERYHRRRKAARYARYTEYRLRLTIITSTGKDIILTDTATGANGPMHFISSNNGELADEEVPLYHVYKAIKEQRQI